MLSNPQRDFEEMSVYEIHRRCYQGTMPYSQDDLYFSPYPSQSSQILSEEALVRPTRDQYQVISFASLAEIVHFFDGT